MARHGVPLAPSSTVASVNGKMVSPTKTASDYFATPSLVFKCNCNIASYAPTQDKILEFTSTSSGAEYEKLDTPAYLVTKSMIITLGENVGELWLERLLMNCFFRLETLTLNGTNDALL